MPGYEVAILLQGKPCVFNDMSPIIFGRLRVCSDALTPFENHVPDHVIGYCQRTINNRDASDVSPHGHEQAFRRPFLSSLARER